MALVEEAVVMEVIVVLADASCNSPEPDRVRCETLCKMEFQETDQRAQWCFYLRRVSIL
jgi:hypothetical protein